MGRRGPKAKAGKRENNGQLSRKEAAARHLEGLDKEQRDMISVGIEARQRVWGVPAPLSRDQLAGSAIGRYYLQGQITRIQLDAAVSWLSERADYMRAIDAPREPGAVDLNATRGRAVGAENVTRVRQAIAARDVTNKAVMAKQIEIGNMGNLFGALDAVLVREVQLEHLLGDLRTALNALVKRYGLASGRAAA